MSWLSDLEANPGIDELAQATAGMGAVAQTQHGRPQAEPPPTQPAAQPGGAPSGGGMDLVDYNGRQVNRSKVSHFDGLRGAVPGLTMTSAYRSPAQNAAAGGVKHSDHLSGDATDWTGSAKDMYAGAAWANANGAKQAMVHNSGSGMHLHTAW